MKLCVDFTRLIPKDGDLYHGGGYYTYQIINGLLEKLNDGLDLSVLWPMGYQPKIEADALLIKNTRINHIYTSDMWVENYSKFDTLFLPLIDPWNFPRLKAIKEKYANLRTVVTLHDLRILDILRLDKYNKYYFKNGMAEYILHYMNRHLKFAKCKKGLKKAADSTDLLMTDSNFSMQQILKFTKPLNINYYYISIDDSHVIKKEIKEEFILFVSANREEKNFMRSLEAYLKAVKEHKTELPLWVTGTGKNFIDVVKRNKSIDMELFHKHVRLLGYVSEEEIQDLYAQCSFLLYTSKSEGFGLPALNAGIYGRPVVAANRTSVPEVLGSTALYVDPYSVSAIEWGIEFMSERKNREMYESSANAYVPILKMLMKTGQNRIIDVLTER